MRNSRRLNLATVRSHCHESLFKRCDLLSGNRLTFLIILLLVFVNESYQQSSISLTTADWFVSNANQSLILPARVPGGIYTDLRRNDVLKQDILYGKNDMAYRWVGNENWTYATTFTIDNQIARSQSVKLILHGIDTVSTIFLNGHEVGSTDNMFVRYKFDIKPYLKLAGLQNALVIKFESPIKYSARKSHQSIRQNRGKIIPPYCPSPAQRGECHVNFIRKMQASFSWDWGPAFPSVGIYKDIEIEFGSFGIVRDILVETKRLSIASNRPHNPPRHQSVVISSSIREQVRTPTINKTVPYIRAPPYYMVISGGNRNVLADLPQVELNSAPEQLASEQLEADTWLLKVTLVADMVQPSVGYNMRVEFNLNDMLHYESEHVNVLANADGFIRLGFNLRIDPSRLKVKPWWPNNAGSQTLYRLSARLSPIPNTPPDVPDHIRLQTDSNLRFKRQVPPNFPFTEDPLASRSLRRREKPLRSPAPSAMMVFTSSQDGNAYQIQYVSEKSITFGFRTVELIQETVSPGNFEDGSTFNFRINGIDLFAMGSNWIPSSVLPEYSNDAELFGYLLQSAKDANMNMLRVWGGGIYESDEFYSMADEMGIMIWHDFMFACALYPVDDDFLSSVRLEVEQQVQRLQHHPSIVLWAGNNENEMAIAGPWWPEVLVWNRKLRESYAKMYVETIRPIVQILDPTRPYVESSPSNGLASRAQPYSIARTPNDNKFGDVHHYDYLADSFDWTNYPSTRFASEYGFQSYPSFNSLSSVTLPTDWKYPLSSNILHRQHRLTGETEMKLQIKMHFHELPQGGVDKFKHFLYVSQLTQAIAIKTETEFYRRNRFIDPMTKLGKTMGALYWQLNDVWQAPTWSSIEYGGKWKMLHYFARRFFFPIQVMPYLVQPPGTSVRNVLQQILTNVSSILTGSADSQQGPQASLFQQQQQQQQTFNDQRPSQQQQQQQSTMFVVDLVRDDLFHWLDSFNVTIRYYRYTSFVPVWQDSIYVRYTQPQNVTRIYELDLARFMRQTSMISLSSGVFQVIVEQQPRLGLSQIDNYLMPVNPSRVTAMRVARISVELVQGPFELTDVRPTTESPNGQVGPSSQWSCAYRLTLVSDSIAMFVWIDLNLLEADRGGRAPSTNETGAGAASSSAAAENFNRPEHISLDALPRPTGSLSPATSFYDRLMPPQRITVPSFAGDHYSSAATSFMDASPGDFDLSRSDVAPQSNGGEQENDGLPQPSSRSKRQAVPPHRQQRQQQQQQQQQPRRHQILNFKPLPGTGSAMLRYQFSDNVFNMFEPSKVVDLYLNHCLSKSQVESAIEIRSLADVL